MPPAPRLAIHRPLLTHPSGANRSLRTVLLATVASLLLVAQATAAVTPTASMGTARSGHVAVALPTATGVVDRILVAGGTDAAGLPLASTEIFDVATGLWSPGPALTTQRTGAVAVPIPAGIGGYTLGGVFLMGGTNANGGVANPEILDVATNSWSSLPAFALSPLRTGITVSLSGSRIVVTGGQITAGAGPPIVATVQMYDLATATPITAPAMLSPRTAHAAAVLPSGRILVSGGYAVVSTTTDAVATAETFDPAAPGAGWTATGPMTTPRAEHTLTPADPPLVLAAGGVPTAIATGPPLASAERYDPATNAWTATGSMAVARRAARAVALRPGWVAVTGGTAPGTPQGLANAETWTPTFGWAGLYGLPGPESIGAPRALHTATAIPQRDEILLAGGGAPAVATAVRYAPERPAVLPPSPAPTPAPAPEPVPAPTPSPATPAPIAPIAEPVPVQGRSVAIAPVSGTVFVRIGRTDEFRELRTGEAVPVGTVVDTTDGRIRLTAAVGTGRQSADFFGGTFEIRQPAREGGLVELRLVGKPQCSSRKAAAAVKRRSRPRVWGDGKGKFRTRGAHSSASVRGTRWLVEERCAGTFTRVARGKVLVRDFTRRRSFLLKAPRTYLARPARR